MVWGYPSRILYLIAFFAFVRLITVPFCELGVDEAHYALYAKYLDLSYFDHPPLVGWIHFVFTSILGANLFALRLSAILISIVISLQIYELMRRNAFDDKTIFAAIAALNASFIFDVLSMALLPDTLLIAITLWTIFAFCNILQTPTLKNYLILGFVLGLAGLSKYTAVLLLAALLLYITYHKKFSIIFTYKTVVAAIVGLLVVSPVLIWNIQNNFASFTYQSTHVAGGNSWNIINFGISLGRQFLAYSPPLFLIALYGFYKRFKNADIAVFIGLVTVLFFGYSQGVSLALPHWTVSFFVLFIPFGIGVLAQNNTIWAQKTLRYSIIFSICLMLIAHLELIFKIGSFPDYKNPFQDLYGWREAAKKGDELLKQNNADVLAVPNWTMGSRIAYYSNDPVIVLQDKASQFNYWAPQDAKSAIVVTDYFSNLGDTKCKNATLLYEQNASLNGSLVNNFRFYLCKDFQ